MTQPSKNELYIKSVESVLAESPIALDHFRKLITENNIQREDKLSLPLNIPL